MYWRRAVQMVLVPFALVVAGGVAAATPSSAKPKLDDLEISQCFEENGARPIVLVANAPGDLLPIDPSAEGIQGFIREVKWMHHNSTFVTVSDDSLGVSGQQLVTSASTRGASLSSFSVTLEHGPPPHGTRHRHQPHQ